MGICWYCWWGWSKAVGEIYKKFAPIAGYDAMNYGAAHIIWADENFDREHVQWCLDHFDEYKRDESTPEQNEAVRQSLIALLALPDEQLSPEPADYDDENPDRYPPKVEMMQKHRIYEILP